MRGGGHDLGIGVTGNLSFELWGLRIQLLLFGMRGQGCKFGSYCLRELLHLGIFTRFDDLAVTHGTGIVHGDIVQ